MRREISRLLSSLVVVSIFPGCGSPGPFSYVPVEGILTYEDGSSVPKSGIQLKFIALDAPDMENAKPRPAIAHLDSEGRFDLVTSYKYGDGLVPGRHKVAILYAKKKDGELLVPRDYTSTVKTPLVISTDDLPLQIKVPKP